MQETSLVVAETKQRGGRVDVLRRISEWKRYTWDQAQVREDGNWNKQGMVCLLLFFCGGGEEDVDCDGRSYLGQCPDLAIAER